MSTFDELMEALTERGKSLQEVQAKMEANTELLKQHTELLYSCSQLLKELLLEMFNLSLERGKHHD